MNERAEGWIWWKHGVIYHIYPRSFYDSSGDGIGDLHGIIARLDYLQDLGIDGIWLSPVYPSPMVDSGYDITDFRGIDPVFGTLNDFRRLLDEAHARGIRVIMDLVMNHTSDQHPWFQDSRSSLHSPRRNWYIWSDGKGKKLPTNWRSAMGGSAWTRDNTTGQFYMHSFFKEQPDLNWRDRELQEVFFGEARYWLEMGVDGFRLDVINYIVKDDKMRDNPSDRGFPLFHQPKYTRNRPRSLKIIRDFRKMLEEYPERTSIGEIYTMPPGDARAVAKYLGDGADGLHMAFDFSLIFRSWNAAKYFRCIREWYRRIPENGWPCNVLSNHDLLRSINRFPWRRHQLKKAKVAAVLLLTLRGTPFLYYGEEIGIKNRPIPYRKILDPIGKRFWPLFSGRDKARTPMQWDATPHAGFTTGIPWLPVGWDYRTVNVSEQLKDPGSLLNVYRNMIRARRNHPSLREGNWEVIRRGRRGLLVYARTLGDEECVVMLNFTNQKKKCWMNREVTGTVIFSTEKRSGELYLNSITAQPFEATVLKSVGAERRCL